MNEHLEELKERIRERLGDLDMVIGWGRGFDPLRATPLFIRSEKDLDKLVLSPLCVHNLATYLPSLKGKKVGVVVKGCDSRTIIELLQEKLVNREDVTVFGLPCQGVVSLKKVEQAAGDLGLVREVKFSGPNVELTTAKGALALPVAQVAADKCGRCQHHNALVSDVFVGEPIEETATDSYEDVLALESMTPEEQQAFWQDNMRRCISCHACRNACPMCVCRDHCVAQSRDPHWITQQDTTKEKWFFQMIHAMHLAGRCTECGECERACPMDIPILLLKRKLNKDILELFNYQAGVSLDAIPPLSCFKVKEETIKERGW